jgi:hypothetical protein
MMTVDNLGRRWELSVSQSSDRTVRLLLLLLVVVMLVLLLLLIPSRRLVSTPCVPSTKVTIPIKVMISLRHRDSIQPFSHRRQIGMIKSDESASDNFCQPVAGR